MVYGRLIDESKQATLGEELMTVELALEETQDTGTQKTAQSYTVKPTSAEKKITMMLTDQKPMAIEGQMCIRDRLWNKQSGVSVTGEVPAIEVKMTAGAQDEICLLDEVLADTGKHY